MIRNSWRIIFASMCAIFISSCASFNEAQNDRCALSRAEIYSRIDTKKLIEEVAQGLCVSSDKTVDVAQMSPDDAVLVPDVVDIQSLRPESLGLALGELFRSSVSNICRQPIRQVDLSRDLKMNRDGMVALTRESALARQQEFKAQNAYIVTYNAQPNKLTLVARNVSLDTATIVGISTREVTWMCSTSSSGANQFNYKFN